MFGLYKKEEGNLLVSLHKIIFAVSSLLKIFYEMETKIYVEEERKSILFEKSQFSSQERRKKI